MRLYRIEDVEWEDVKQDSYHLAVFASGYEERATHVASRLGKARLRQAVVLAFQEVDKHPQRQRADTYYERFWNGQKVVLGAGEDEPIYAMLREKLRDIGDEVRVLVDYSSMSRVWYAAVLNWIRYASWSGRVSLDLVYAVGDHRERVLPKVTRSIMAIPGCEGTGAPISRAIAVFGLGFDGVSTLSVLDALEPDVTYGYLASPGAFPDYPDRARKENDEFINKYAQEILELPLQSVERTFSHLSELVSPHLREDDVSIVPMGPKPHVLAALLLAMKFKRVACLRVSTRRQQSEDVGTTGEIVATRIEFRQERQGITGKLVHLE
jgi:hypothetical protein